MIATIVIMSVSLAMFVYWFRYSCLLILDSDWNEEVARDFASKNGLAFEVSDAVLAAPASASELNRLRESVENDLRRLQRLMSACPAMSAGASLENRMLMLDFQLMNAWFACTRTRSESNARRALKSMSRIVGYLAGELGEMATAQG